MGSRQQISYRDAVILLAGEDTKLVQRIDRALGGAILGSSIIIGPGAFAFLEAKNAALEVAQDFLSHLSVRLRGLTVPARGDRIRAACSIITVTAFVAAARAAIGKERWHDLGIRPDELIPVEGETNSKDSFLTALVKSGLPTIEIHKGYDDLEANLKAFYQRVAERLLHLIGGLVIWDHLNQTERGRLTTAITDALPATAVQEYKSQFLKLANDVPELAVWLNLQEHLATRQAFKEYTVKSDNAIEAAITASEEMNTTLDGMYLLLKTVTKGMPAPSARWRRSLAAANAHELERPLLDVKSEHVAGVVAPSPEGGYINPDFRVAEASRNTLASVEQWWEGRPRQSNLQNFLASYVTSTSASNNPLLILGHPGAGKSVLSRVVAAKLPVEGFAPIRVSLRDVAANSSVISQIEQAFHNVIHETISWPEFVECLDGALPVIILDGFDELLQATGISQSDYLEKVRQFQDSEQGQGRPVVVIVTSRTAVAHRARIPESTLIIKLEPFDAGQIGQWISNWNSVNRNTFLERNLKQLDAEVVMRHYELASQPILLLMLAIYDADANGLAPNSAPMSRVSLYERLLVTFVERELLKDSAALTSEALHGQTEMELYQLSIVAFGMFNRNAQIISVNELDRDFAGLNLVRTQALARREFSAELTSAQRALGRFFFIHRSEAREDIESPPGPSYSTKKISLGETFEFLHATFGEYLVARSALKIIMQAGVGLDVVRPWHPQQPVTDEPLLVALLSFEPFSKRAQIVTFAAEIAATMSVEERRRGLAVCRILLGRANWPTNDMSYRNYLPSEQDTIARAAAYSANLVLIGIALAGHISLDEIAPISPSSVAEWWRSTALVWQGRFDREAWRGLTRIILIYSDRESDKLSICLRPESDIDVYTFPTLQRELTNFVDALKHTEGQKRGWTGVSERLLDERRSHELLLDELGLLNIDLALHIRSELGTAAETIAAGLERDSESIGPSVGLGENTASGASILLALILGCFDHKSEFNMAFDTALILSWRDGNIDFKNTGTLRAIDWLVETADRNIEMLVPDQVISLILAGINASPGRESFSYYIRLLKLWLRFIKTYPLQKGRPSRNEVVDGTINEAVAKLFSLLDPNHWVGSADMLRLILEIEQAGVRIERIAPEFGGLSDWLLRSNIASLSYENAGLAAEIILFAVAEDAQWLQDAGLVNVAAFSPAAFALLPLGLMSDLINTFRQQSLDFPEEWLIFKNRLGQAHIFLSED